MTVYLPYRLHLNRPAVFRAPGGDPNSARSLDHVPGSTFRGIVAGAVSSDTELLNRLVLSSKVRYLNAYLGIGTQRCMPAPMAWQAEKSSAMPTRGFDLSAATVPDDFAGQSVRYHVAGPPDPDALDQSLTLARTKGTGRMHNQRDPRKGRSWEDANGETHGALYSYEAVAADQDFYGMIALDDESLAEEIQALLPDSVQAGNGLHDGVEPTMLHIGRSRLAGYGGRAALSWLPIVQRETSETLWSMPESVQADERFRIILTADCICRHPTSGELDPSALRAAIEQALPVEVEQAWVAATTVGGFNRRWGMPLPSWSAAQAGTTLTLRAKEAVDRAVLIDFENRGLGLRRRDGFGRVTCTTLPDRPELSFRSPPPPVRPLKPTGQPPQVILDIERRHLRNRLDRDVDAAAHHIANSATKLPTPSLIGRLRTIIRQQGRVGLVPVLNPPPSNGAKDQAGGLRNPARTQLTKGRIRIDGRQVNLVDGFQQLAGLDKAAFGRLVDLDTAQDRARLTSDPPSLDQAEFERAATNLVAEVLDRLHLRARQIPSSATTADDTTSRKEGDR